MEDCSLLSCWKIEHFDPQERLEYEGQPAPVSSYWKCHGLLIILLSFKFKTSTEYFVFTLLSITFAVVRISNQTSTG